MGTPMMAADVLTAYASPVSSAAEKAVRGQRLVDTTMRACGPIIVSCMEAARHCRVLIVKFRASRQEGGVRLYHSLCLRAVFSQQVQHLRMSRKNRLYMQREVSASAERHASIPEPGFCRNAGNPEENRSRALRTGNEICAVEQYALFWTQYWCRE